MKLSMKHLGARSTGALDWVENELAALEPTVQIDEATVQLVCGWHDSPPFSVQIQLLTPKPTQ